MRNLRRLTYAANRMQAWEDWRALADEAAQMGYAYTAPDANATTRQIDKAIGELRQTLQAADPAWSFTLPSAR